MDTENTKIITISVSEYLSEELALQISKAIWRQSDISGVRSMLYWFKSETNYFNVIAKSSSGDLVGRVCCMQNLNEPTLWYYGDLFVVEAHRRGHIAESILLTAFDVLKDKGCKTIRTYVDPENVPSLELQKKLGFTEKTYQPFNHLINDGDIMFEKSFGQIYNAVTVRNNFDVKIVADLYNQNLKALHGVKIAYDEWFRALLNKDTDEQNFLICRGLMPIAWLKLNGLDDMDIGYISMLAVEPKYHHKGVGTYAVGFAERFLRNKGKKIVRMQTTSDNLTAIKLYKKCGFVEVSKANTVCNDNAQLCKIMFEKDISVNSRS